MARIEARVDPGDVPEADAFLRDALPPDRCDALHSSSWPDAFPEAELSQLLRGPFGELLDPRSGWDWPELMRWCVRLAAHDLGFTLCAGGVVLGALPVVLEGDADQQARFFDPVRDGQVAGLALSEWDHGSDLLSNEATATPLDGDPKTATRFRLHGEKRPINNASRGAHVVTLVRTGKGGDPFGATLMMLPREALRASGHVEWGGFAGLDLDGVVLDAEVGRDAILGKPGDGFALARRTLEISRGGVACMAVGASVAALAHALHHARTRTLYGAPIRELEAVQTLLVRITARCVVSAALARVAARNAQHAGRNPRAAMSARPWTSAAKLLCPQLLEANVSDAGTVLGARSLMRSHRFWRLRRDAPTLAIFDGSSQLQRDELWRHARRWTDLERSAPDVGDDPSPTPLQLPGVLGEAAAAARALVKEDLPQPARSRLSEVLGWLYATHALQLLGDDEAHVLAAPFTRDRAALASHFAALGHAELAARLLTEDRGHDAAWVQLATWEPTA